jgi:hypothetical protein
MRSRTALLTLVFAVVAACALSGRPSLSPARMAELWQEPSDIARRDLFNGPGGAALAPDPDGRYALLETDNTGFSPGYDVKDGDGREWSIKLGPESRTEVVVGRIVWAMGYHQPPTYYLPSWTLVDNGTVKKEGRARFRLKPEAQKTVGEWSWRSNPFVGTQPLDGLFVLMVIVNNWDIKSQQNALYRVAGDGEQPRDSYVVKDLGASLGKTSWLLPGTRDDIEAFEREPFIRDVSGNRVTFHFQGAWREPQLLEGIEPADVRWISERLARLSADQWMDAFRAGGYAEAEASRFIRRLREKVEEGLRIGEAN